MNRYHVIIPLGGLLEECHSHYVFAKTRLQLSLDELIELTVAHWGMLEMYRHDIVTHTDLMLGLLPYLQHHADIDDPYAHQILQTVLVLLLTVYDRAAVYTEQAVAYFGLSYCPHVKVSKFLSQQALILTLVEEDKEGPS